MFLVDSYPFMILPDPKILSKIIFGTDKEMVQLLLYYYYLWINQASLSMVGGWELDIHLVGWLEDEVCDDAEGDGTKGTC